MKRMTNEELETIHREAFAAVRAHSSPAVHGILDSLERALALSTAQIEAQRFHATLLEGMLDTRLAVVERDGD